MKLTTRKILIISFSIFLILGSVLAVSNSNKVKLTLNFILDNYKEECLEYEQIPDCSPSYTYQTLKDVNDCLTKFMVNNPSCAIINETRGGICWGSKNGNCIAHHLVRRT